MLVRSLLWLAMGCTTPSLTTHFWSREQNRMQRSKHDIRENRAMSEPVNKPGHKENNQKKWAWNDFSVGSQNVIIALYQLLPYRPGEGPSSWSTAME